LITLDETINTTRRHLINNVYVQEDTDTVNRDFSIVGIGLTFGVIVWLGYYMLAGVQIVMITAHFRSLFQMSL